MFDFVLVNSFFHHLDAAASRRVLSDLQALLSDDGHVHILDLEDGAVVELLERLGRVLAGLPGGPHEVVLVDDGSTDRTGELLAAAAAADPRVVAISLSRRFGHQAALSAALDHVRGDVVIVMDGDLQDPPEAIPQFMAEYHKGFDVVYARRVRRKEGALLRLGYFVFYRTVALLSDVRLPLDAGDFALLSGRVVDGLRSLPEHHRYLRGLGTWVGFRQTGIPVERSERFAGASKYSPVRLFGLAFDAVFEQRALGPFALPFGSSLLVLAGRR